MVDFERAGNPAWAPALKTGELGVDGVPVTTFAFDITGHGFRDMGCTRQTAVFTNLLKTSVTLTFAGTTPGVGGPVIDDVRIRSCLLGALPARLLTPAAPGACQCPPIASGAWDILVDH
ncbi:hypothetical protein [Streptomyces clavifer]|uniref:hypothetical protein n=1 Tax=Streptomyces clavifer TaxID=68188 RepID=UPI0036C1CDE7